MATSLEGDFVTGREEGCQEPLSLEIEREELGP